MVSSPINQFHGQSLWTRSFTGILLLLSIGGFIAGRSLGNLYDTAREITFLDAKRISPGVPRDQTQSFLVSANPALAEKIATRSSVAAQLLKGQQWLKLERFLTQWATIDIEAALGWAQSLPLPYSIQARRQVVLAWLAAKPDDAFSWVRQFDPAFLSSNQLYEALAKTGRYDLGIQAINSLKHRFFSLRELVKAWGQADRSGAMLYLNELARTNYGDWVAAATAFAPILAREDFSGAVAWVTTNARSANEVRLICQDIARSLLKEGDVESVQDWAALAGSTPQGYGVSLALAEHYATLDPVAAVGWLNKIDDGRIKNLSSTATIALMKSRPDLAANIIEQEPNAIARNHRLGLVVDQWARTDPAAAIEYTIQTPALSEAARAQILQKLNAAGIHQKE